jgi:quercetin dioxygenase-like cupin family protein
VASTLQHFSSNVGQSASPVFVVGRGAHSGIPPAALIGWFAVGGRPPLKREKIEHIVLRERGDDAMTRTKSLLLVAATGGLLLLACSQEALAQDPAVVNAKTIRVRLENSRVRVLEATLQPGQKEHLHSHPASVIYVIAGGKLRNHSAGGKTTESEITTGDTIYREPFTHWAENIGTTTIHLIVVELKNPT